MSSAETSYLDLITKVHPFSPCPIMRDSLSILTTALARENMHL